MSRTLAALAAIAALFLAGVAAAQTQSTAPTVNAGTRLSFPATLGGAQLERSVNYAAPPANRPDQGFSYFYSTPKRMVITVHIYDGGRRVPAGGDNPVVLAEFASELAEAEQQIKGAGYTSFQRPSVPSACSYGSVVFRCITYSALNQSNARIYSKMMLTGFRDHYLKIRIDWGQALQQTGPEAEAALQAFVPALLR